jgi:hypothetical protein
LQKNHFYSVFFAPRGYNRITFLGWRISQEYLSPYDKLIGIIGSAGSGKSMLIKGMFPGIELTNDDNGVNVRPLPLLDVLDEDDDDPLSGFYSPHTYHLDINFEGAFVQKHTLVEAILKAVKKDRRVVVEHFDLIYPMLKLNADLLIGVGEEVIITRPTIFGPEPHDIAEIVFKSQAVRRMTHTAEDLCEFVMRQHGLRLQFQHSDVRHGFLFSFAEKPELDISLEELEAEVNKLIEKDIPISFHDDTHILIGGEKWLCHGPRMHVKTTSEIKNFKLGKEYLSDPTSGRLLLVGVVGEKAADRFNDLNRIGMGE